MTHEHDRSDLRVFSFGGGVQSMAVLVLAARGVVQYDAFLFSNVGDDSEYPKTLDYFYERAVPYAEENGIPLHGLQKVTFGKPETLVEYIYRTKRSVPIPARMSNGAPGRRSCTADFKIKVVGKWLRLAGATKDNPAVVGLGISMDEIQRMNSGKGLPYQVREYPLIDLRMNRMDCINLIADEGLPVPPKSACYFCPFHTHDEWKRLKREEPELFQKAVEIELHINEKRESLGRDQLYLHSTARPLEQAVGMQLSLLDEPACESGYCMT